ncbi:hypothetical protein [Streptomyces sp. TRM49041]|uniref:DUF7683 domain-containing protein n=1 Tax=Streptomyces sp. TRM49041 TaxID=2603216 RepID=UPI0011EC00DB|nr:hypothetical protein [Streptomyces sp. TRM49041]
MQYLVIAYGKLSEAVEQETDVSSVGGERLAELMGVPVEGLVDVYPLDGRHRAALSAHVDITYDLDAYDYFLEVVAD